MTTVLCNPQWQGSKSPYAAALPAGARRTAELVPADRRVDVAVHDGHTGMADGVRDLAALVENLRQTHAALDDATDLVVTAGGDCGVELAPIAAARAAYGDELTVLWIDAHPDVSTPATLESGSFHGMVLRTLLGDGAAALVPGRPLSPDQCLLVGIRSFEPGQREYLDGAGVRWHGVDGVDDVDSALDAAAGPTYVHVDLDVLDPGEFGSVGYPEPGGLSVERVLALIGRVPRMVGASITEHAPREDSDLARDRAVVARIGAALCR